MTNCEGKNLLISRVKMAGRFFGASRRDLFLLNWRGQPNAGQKGHSFRFGSFQNKKIRDAKEKEEKKKQKICADIENR